MMDYKKKKLYKIVQNILKCWILYSLSIRQNGVNCILCQHQLTEKQTLISHFLKILVGVVVLFDGSCCGKHIEMCLLINSYHGMRLIWLMQLTCLLNASILFRGKVHQTMKQPKKLPMQVMQSYINSIICFNAYKCWFDIHYLFLISLTPIYLFYKMRAATLTLKCVSGSKMMLR